MLLIVRVTSCTTEASVGGMAMVGVAMGVVIVSVAGIDVVDFEFCDVLVRLMKEFCGAVKIR